MPKETPSLYEEIGNGIKVARHLLTTTKNTIGLSRGVNVVTEGPRSVDAIKEAIGAKLNREIQILESPFNGYSEDDVANSIFGFSYSEGKPPQSIQSIYTNLNELDSNQRNKYQDKIINILASQMIGQEISKGSTEITDYDNDMTYIFNEKILKPSTIDPQDRCAEIAKYLETTYSKKPGSVKVEYRVAQRAFHITYNMPKQ